MGQHWLSWLLALRYFKGKNGLNFVPILSKISMGAIAVGTAALLIVLSVTNGFNALVGDLYKAFYPELKIEAASGKYLTLSQDQVTDIQKLDGIERTARVLEDNALLQTEQYQKVVHIMGVESSFFTVTDYKTYADFGIDSLPKAAYYTPALMGSQLAAALGIEISNIFSNFELLYPKSDAKYSPMALPTDLFNTLQCQPYGSFTVQEEFDNLYTIVPIEAARQLFGVSNANSSMHIKLKPGFEPALVKKQLSQLLGPSVVIKERAEQNPSLYNIMQVEKWASFAILFFILTLAAFNMLVALLMLTLQKAKDFAVLSAMGLPAKQKAWLIIKEGWLWTFTGTAIGLGIGLILLLLQDQWGLVPMQGSFIINYYPVDIQYLDLLFIAIAASIVGTLMSLYPALKAYQTPIQSLKAQS